MIIGADYVGQLIEDLYVIYRIKMHATIRACDFIYHRYYYGKATARAAAFRKIISYNSSQSKFRTY